MCNILVDVESIRKNQLARLGQLIEIQSFEHWSNSGGYRGMVSGWFLYKQKRDSKGLSGSFAGHEQEEFRGETGR